MPKKGTKRQTRRFPHEETWLHEFVGVGGTERVTSFTADDLGRISLTRIVEALACGTVVHSEKSDGVGADCIIEHYADDGDHVRVFVNFVANEEKLTILEARKIEESGHEPDRAA